MSNASNTTSIEKKSKGGLIGFIIDHKGAAKNLFYAKALGMAVVGAAKIAIAVYVIANIIRINS